LKNTRNPDREISFDSAGHREVKPHDKELSAPLATSCQEVNSFGEWLMRHDSGNKDHGYAVQSWHLLRVLPASLAVHGGKVEGLRGVTDDGLQGGIRRSWFRIVY